HLRPLYGRWSIAIETGRRADAALLADAFLRERTAWTPYEYTDMSIWGIVYAYLGGAISRDAFQTARADWVERAKAVTTAGGQSGPPTARSWWLGFALPIQSSDDTANATDALAALEKYGPLPDPMTRRPDIDEQVGLMYLGAGEAEKALPYLARASRS